MSDNCRRDSNGANDTHAVTGDGLDECAERQESEVRLLEAMYCLGGEWELLNDRLATAEPWSFAVTTGGIRCGLTLPFDYPAYAPPELNLRCSLLSNAQVDHILSILRSIADERTRAEAPNGGECVCDLIREALNHVEAAYNTAVKSSGSHASGSNVRDSALVSNMVTPTMQELVLRVDHMNKPKQYLSKLSKWCKQLGLSGRVWHRPPTRDNARIQDVYIALLGVEGPLDTFLARLRTEYVDVDSRGVRCKERKSTVLSRRNAPPNSEPISCSLEITGCYEPGSLEDILIDLKLSDVA